MNMSSNDNTSESIPFDYVKFNDNNTVVELSFSDFMTLPLHVRIQHMIADETAYFLNGKKIPRIAVLSSIIDSSISQL